jgi:H+/gluconate symporter-like permease
MRTLSKTLFAVALACAASPALAQKAPAPAAAVTPTASDIRCMLAMGAIASNPNSRQAATLGAYYFQGRISARAPTLDLPSAMKAEVARLDQATMQNEAKRCVALVNQASQTMQTVQAAFAKPVAVPPTGAAPAAPTPK